MEWGGVGASNVLLQSLARNDRRKVCQFPPRSSERKKKKKPFACCRFAQSDANQRRPNRVLGSSRCDTTECPRLRANTGVEKSLSGRRSLTEFHLEDLQPFTRRFASAESGVVASPEAGRGKQHCCRLDETLARTG